MNWIELLKFVFVLRLGFVEHKVVYVELHTVVTTLKLLPPTLLWKFLYNFYENLEK